MPCSLKDAVQQQQPKCTKSTIKQALHSIGGAQRVWCVVEAPDDVKVYEQFFDKAVSILPSDDEDGRRSCRNVESIVSELHAEEGNLHLLGIRDCDYTRYDDSYKAPNHVFVTFLADMAIYTILKCRFKSRRRWLRKSSSVVYSSVVLSISMSIKSENTSDWILKNPAFSFFIVSKNSIVQSST